jgi:hypothetical protein
MGRGMWRWACLFVRIANLWIMYDYDFFGSTANCKDTRDRKKFNCTSSDPLGQV